MSREDRVPSEIREFSGLEQLEMFLMERRDERRALGRCCPCVARRLARRLARLLRRRRRRRLRCRGDGLSCELLATLDLAPRDAKLALALLGESLGLLEPPARLLPARRLERCLDPRRFIHLVCGGRVRPRRPAPRVHRRRLRVRSLRPLLHRRRLRLRLRCRHSRFSPLYHLVHLDHLVHPHHPGHPHQYGEPQRLQEQQPYKDRHGKPIGQPHDDSVT
jgi:hypothetical protein